MRCRRVKLAASTLGGLREVLSRNISITKPIHENILDLVHRLRVLCGSQLMKSVIRNDVMENRIVHQ